MDIFKYDVYRGPNIGIYAKVNDEKIFLPRGYAKSKAAYLEECLEVEALYTSVANTRLIGPLMALNNHGMLLPNTISEMELEFYKKYTDLNISILDTKYTAIGNMVGVNDKGGVVSPIIPKDEIKQISDALDVEIVQRKIAGYNQVGAMMACTSTGGIIHPETDEEDIKRISDVLGINLEAATINGGIPYVSSGILANNKSAVAGSFTSGPEIMMLTRAFAA